MFDIGWGELLVIAVVALVVIGPKDLPYALRTLGQWASKARALAREFQNHVDDLIRESEVSDMKREFNDMTRPPDGLEDELMAGRSAKPGASPTAGAVPKPEDPPVPTDAPLASPPAP